MAKASALCNLSTSNGAKTEVAWGGGLGNLHAFGTWDGASLTLQFRPVKPTDTFTTGFVNTPVVLDSSKGTTAFHLPQGTIRVEQASSGVTTSLSCVASVEIMRVG